MTKPITPEMIAAWRTLQAYAEKLPRYVNPTTEEAALADAIGVLDDSDYMVPIEEVGNELETAAQFAPNGLDPAEWGDTTREDMARHQREERDAREAREAETIAAGGEVHVTRMALDDLHGEGLLKAIRKSKAKKSKP